ncbi:TIGR02300 family protein [Telmatospirillum sp. J64-1]|uniref:TIGR02300 family protein n=1 Tax=Telmatospirillum sp. J64-1 TaxID=2502183 RepID=UPI00115C9692|nr:TIGR02300 family protein [Telmatospirillum sp. J64-1]
MAKPEWGTKRTCLSCSARFYDMLRSPITCPKCGTTLDPEAPFKVKRPTAADKSRLAAEKKAAAAALLVDDVADDEDDVADVDDNDEDDSGLIEDASDLGEDDDDMAEVMEHVDGDLEDEV